MVWSSTICIVLYVEIYVLIRTFFKRHSYLFPQYREEQKELFDSNTHLSLVLGGYGAYHQLSCMKPEKKTYIVPILALLSFSCSTLKFFYINFMNFISSPSNKWNDFYTYYVRRNWVLFRDVSLVAHYSG